MRLNGSTARTESIALRLSLMARPFTRSPVNRRPNPAGTNQARRPLDQGSEKASQGSGLNERPCPKGIPCRVWIAAAGLTGNRAVPKTIAADGNNIPTDQSAWISFFPLGPASSTMRAAASIISLWPQPPAFDCSGRCFSDSRWRRQLSSDAVSASQLSRETGLGH
jgi:hypothetical protein